MCEALQTGPVQGSITAALPLKWNYILADSALQLLEVIIHHGVIKLLGGW